MRIGLVLGAGGVAGGAFHAGVLAALEAELGWDPRTADVVVGTSAGSIAGTSLRAGLSAADMLARAAGRPVSAAGARLLAGIGAPVSPPPLRPGGRVRPPQELLARVLRSARRPFAARPMAVLAGLLPEGSVGTEFISQAVAGLAAAAGAGWPERDLWICAVRASDGRRTVFGKDRQEGGDPPLADAVAASCAIPGFFRPVEIAGETYVDGGAHSPTNADLLASGPKPDLVVISSPMSLAGRGMRIGIDQPARRWSRALLDAEVVRLRAKRIPVVAFQPTAEDAAVMGPNAMDPARRADIAAQAFASTRRRLARADTRARLAALTGQEP